ncbi:hypothetical protein CSB45_02440 [candidate division KSB3 bacterium]|uniref:Uncharacterized protein n=1 Tax=candidate division KSB3 bacterium TaxID=2044937 RepID=A0A2G6EAU7_9BACT|nr:MAG: hypothetical protein CSB45_02440 [candidate division KSB3 bacterium]PIE30940.1 MAG: hypothetical protein CSA57_01055 [candidate division KSB3 bacterium]
MDDAVPVLLLLITTVSVVLVVPNGSGFGSADRAIVNCAGGSGVGAGGASGVTVTLTGVAVGFSGIGVGSILCTLAWKLREGERPSEMTQVKIRCLASAFRG